MDNLSVKSNLLPPSIKFYTLSIQTKPIISVGISSVKVDTSTILLNIFL